MVMDSVVRGGEDIVFSFINWLNEEYSGYGFELEWKVLELDGYGLDFGCVIC